MLEEDSDTAWPSLAAAVHVTGEALQSPVQSVLLTEDSHTHRDDDHQGVPGDAPHDRGGVPGGPAVLSSRSLKE